MDDVIRKISDEKFSNWLKVSIGLTITAEGLSDYVKYLTVTIQRDLVSKLGHLKVCSGNCSKNEPNISRWCKTCKAWLDEIMKHNKQSERNIKWMTMDSSKWPTDSEEMGHVFTCFKWNQDGGRKKLKDDILKMISFLNNCRKSTINRQVLSDARAVRNKMAHSSYQHLSESETNECLQRLSNLLNSLEISSTFSGNYASVRLGHWKNLDFLKILSKKDVSIDPLIKQDLESHIREIISKIVIEDRRRSFPIIAILSILFWSLGTTICILTYGIVYLNGSEISSSFRQDVDLCDDSHISNAFQISGDASTLGAISYNGAQLDPIKITRALNHAVDRGQLPVVTCLHNVGGAYNNFSLLIAVRSPSVSKHMVEFILKTGNWTAEQKEEALHESCFRGNLEIVKYLLQNGAKYNEYSLLTTVSGPDDNKYMVDFILKSGNWSENQKMEGMDDAIFRGKLNTVRLLYEMNVSFSNFSLLTAVRSRFDDKHLVQFISASKQWTEEQKTEALDAACYRGKINTVINLHQNGAQFSNFSLLTSVKSPGDNKGLIEFVFKSVSWTKEQVVEAINETQYQKKLKLFLFLTRSFKPTLSYEKGTYSLVRYNFRESFDQLEAV